MTRLLRLAAWLALAAIFLVTVLPLGLRPVTGASAPIERFAAFAIIGCLFGAAYPRQWRFALALVVGAAVGFEVLQMLTPDRHGRLADLLIKAGGGVVGFGLGLMAVTLARPARGRP